MTILKPTQIEKNLNILIIDDEQTILTFLKRLMELKNHNVDAAYSAEDAIKLINRNKYDVAIIDLKLPGMNGLDFNRILKEKHKDVLSIAITSFKKTYIRTDVKNASFNCMFCKPFNLTKINRYISKVNYLREKVA